MNMIDRGKTSALSCCSDELVKKVLAVADGTITDENIVNNVLEHIATCDSCLELYKTYFEVFADSTIADECNTVDVEINCSNGSLIPLSTAFVMSQQAAVLSSGDNSVVEINYPFDDSIISIKCSYKEDAFDVAVYSDKSIKVHLITNTKHEILTTGSLPAVFRAIGDENILLLFDLRKALKIRLNRN
jgi:hypothetical protein